MLPKCGYAGHEMVSEFNLINMNGRIYDPQLCRFLAPDRFVQAPGNSQSFNRYSYCLNNPLKYVDPSGHSWLSKGWNEFKQMNTHDKIASFIVITGLGSPFTWGTRWSYLSNRLSGDGMSHKEAINNTMIQTWFYGTVGGSDESELPADPYNPDNLGTPSNYNYLSEVYTPEFYRYSELMACNDCYPENDPPLVDVGMDIPYIRQFGDFDCNYACMEGISSYYKGNRTQEQFAQGNPANGINPRQLIPTYLRAGFNVNPLVINAQSIVNNMNNNVATVLIYDLGQDVAVAAGMPNAHLWHSTVVTRVRIYPDGSYKVNVMNPLSGGTNSINSNHWNEVQMLFGVTWGGQP